MTVSRFQRFIHILPIISGAISFLLGLTVIIGWFSHQSFLIQILPQFVAMQFNTALGFIMAGTALISLHLNKPNITIPASILAILIGTLTGSQYVFGLNYHIDQLFMDHYITTEAYHPGRMAPNTAISFTLSSIGMLAAAMVKDPQRQSWMLGIFGSIVIGLGLVAAFGYAFNLPAAYGWPALSNMAMHTSFGFSSLGIGMIALAKKITWADEFYISNLSALWPVSGMVFTLFFVFLLFNALQTSNSNLNNHDIAQPAEIASMVVLIFGSIMGALFGITLWLNRALTIRALEAEALTKKLTLEEVALSESEDRFQRAIAGTNDGIWDWNVKTGYDYFSPRWAEILGYDLDELEPVVQTFTDFVHPDDQERVWEQVQSHLNGGAPLNTEVRMRRKTGDYIWILTRGSVSRDDNGEPTFMAGSITDITHRRNNEEKLQKAKEEAEHASLAKSEFLASMSHELRTPLNAVLGFGQMLQINQNKSLTSKQSEYVANILNGGNHLLELINEILDLSQVEAEQAAISLDDVCAKEVIKECVDQMAPICSLRSIKIINNITHDPKSHIRTDLMRFKQIVINLLSNAVKYNVEGGTITINSRKTANGFLHISVADTGIGINPKDYSNVFNMFQRLGINSGIAQEGTGIGLALCKLLIQQMGGRISFESVRGSGSTFWIELPLASNKGILIWDDSLRVGIEPIDKDHQAMVLLNNSIFNGFHDDETIDLTLLKIVKNTKKHFKRIEIIMELCGYPELKSNRTSNKKLTTKMDKLIKAWQINNDTATRQKLSHFLRDWWIDRIMKVDQGLVHYVRGKQADIHRALRDLDKV